MKNKDEQTIKASAQLLFIVQAEEMLSAQYVSMQSIIVDGLKGINDQRKENRQACETILKSIGNAAEAKELANGMLPARESKDASERKRAQKRRDWLKARLSQAYPSYDFVTSYSRIECEYIGDASDREAGQLMAAINRLSDLGVTVPAVKVEELADSIRNEASQTALGRIAHTDPAILEAKQNILAKLAASMGMTLTLTDGKSAGQVAEMDKAVSN